MYSIVLEVELSTQEANALAEFLKRSGYSTFRAFAQNETEAYQMVAAAEQLRRALASHGYDPR